MQFFQTNKEPSFGQEHSLISNVGAILAPELATAAYLPVANKIISQSKNVSEAQEQQKIVEELLQQMKNKGYSVHSENPARAIRGKISNPIHAGVDFLNRKAYIPKGSNPGVVAHELGHILAPKLLGLLQIPGKVGGGLAGLISAVRQDQDKARRDSLIASGILGTTLLPSEIDASIRGYRALGALDKTKGALRPQLLSRLSRMRSFAGLPTYLMTTAAPFLTYKIREGLGVFDNSTK